MALSWVHTSVKVISARYEMQMAPQTHLWQSPAASPAAPVLPVCPGLGSPGLCHFRPPWEGQTVPTEHTQGKSQGCVPTVAQEEVAVLNAQWFIWAE